MPCPWLLVGEQALVPKAFLTSWEAGDFPAVTTKGWPSGGGERTPGQRRIGLVVSYISCFAKGCFFWIVHLSFCISAFSFSFPSILWPSSPVLCVMGSITRPSSVDTEWGGGGTVTHQDNNTVGHKKRQELRMHSPAPPLTGFVISEDVTDLPVPHLPPVLTPNS